MSQQSDERNLFRRLGEDAQRAHLAPPEDVRRRSDRRTAARAVVGTIAVVVAVAAVFVGGNGLLGNAEPIPPGTASPTEPTSTVSSQAPPESIPQAAWLGKVDLGFEPEETQVVNVLAPCGEPLVPQAVVSAGAVPASGTRRGNYHAPDTPEINTPDGTIAQSIVLLPDERAADALMDSVEAIVADCPDDTTRDPGEIRYSLGDASLPTSSALPDRHILIDVSTSYESIYGAPPDAGSDRIHTYVSVLQVGDAVTILDVDGWEASTTDLEDVHRLARLATARLLDWRR